MFNIGMPELIVILIVAILVIGPKRLPEVANALGKGLAEFKRAMNNVKEELQIDEVRNDVNEMKDSLLFKNSYLDEVKEDKKEPEQKKEVNPETIATPDQADNIAKTDKGDTQASDGTPPIPPSPKSDSGNS